MVEAGKETKMDIAESKIVVIGGAGLIGSHIVEELQKEPVKEIIIYDNFTRGTKDNIKAAFQDERVKCFEGNITHIDVLNSALEGADYVFHLAALWLRHCY